MDQANKESSKLIALLQTEDKINGKTKIDSLNNVIQTIKEQNTSCDEEIVKSRCILLEKAKINEELQMKNAKLLEKWTEIEKYKSEQAIITALRQRVDKISAEYAKYREDAEAEIEQSNTNLKELITIVYNAEIEEQLLIQELNKVNEIYADKLLEQANSIKQIEEKKRQVLNKQNAIVQTIDENKEQLRMRQREFQKKEELQLEILRENAELQIVIDDKQKKNAEIVQKYSEQHLELNKKIQSLEQISGDYQLESDRNKASYSERINELSVKANILSECKLIFKQIPSHSNDDILIELENELKQKQKELNTLQDKSEKHMEKLVELQRYQEQIKQTAAVETTYKKYEELLLDVEKQIAAKHSAIAEARINFENIQSAATKKQKKLLDESEVLSKSFATTRNIYIQELQNIKDQTDAKRLIYKERKDAFSNIYQAYKELKSKYAEMRQFMPPSKLKSKEPGSLPINSAPSTSSIVENEESALNSSQATSVSSIRYDNNGVRIPTFREVYGSKINKK